METNEYTASYYFTHKDTRKHVIAQNWTEFHNLQQNKNYEQQYRLGYNEYYRGFPNQFARQTYEIEEKVNKFWAGAVGYEKVDRINCIGVCYNPIRVVLKNLRNHACMQGDREAVKKYDELDRYYWSDSVGVAKCGNIHQYLLPERTN